MLWVQGPFVTHVTHVGRFKVSSPVMEQLNNLPGLPRCPVCYEVIHEPVVFPCEHEVCLACFTKSLEAGNLCCPLCRKRISSWARRNARNPVCSKRKRQIEEVVAHFDKENVCPVDSSQAGNGSVHISM